jgi:hypothetical protein
MRSGGCWDNPGSPLFSGDEMNNDHYKLNLEEVKSLIQFWCKEIHDEPLKLESALFHLEKLAQQFKLLK